MSRPQSGRAEGGACSLPSDQLKEKPVQPTGLVAAGGFSWALAVMLGTHCQGGSALERKLTAAAGPQGWHTDSSSGPGAGPPGFPCRARGGDQCGWTGMVRVPFRVGCSLPPLEDKGPRMPRGSALS